ncbi:MAG: hypothetical protein ABI863_00475 [Ginsengibacter sp.]
MKKKFFYAINPYFSAIDNGHLFRKPFSALYALVAMVNLLYPFTLAFRLYRAQFDDHSPQFLTFCIIGWVVIAFVSWVSFQLWWNRKSKVIITSNAGDEFVATPVVCHLIRTLGEWIGTWIGIVGFFISLLSIFLPEEAHALYDYLGVSLLDFEFYKFLMPIIGFFIIVVTRFLAEQFTALSSIANNTKNKINKPALPVFNSLVSAQ